MIEVREMENDEISEVLARVGYGHLAVSLNDEPYVVPIQYVVDGPRIYFYTTEGKKSEILDVNPKACLQVEEVTDNEDWRSIVISGIAERVGDWKERERAFKLLWDANPSLTPAISIRWLDEWIRENREVVYRIEPATMTGRFTVKVKRRAAFVQPKAGRPSLL